MENSCNGTSTSVHAQNEMMIYARTSRPQSVRRREWANEREKKWFSIEMAIRDRNATYSMQRLFPGKSEISFEGTRLQPLTKILVPHEHSDIPARRDWGGRALH